MTFSIRNGFVVLALGALTLAAGGCYHLKVNGSQDIPSNPSNTIGPSNPTPTPFNGTCNITAAPGAAIIPMAFAFASAGASPSPYGALNGYGPPNFTPSGVSFDVPTPEPIQLSPGSTVQFQNVELAFNSPRTTHSAAFVGATSFPANYTFPSSLQKASGSSIGGTASWSTGPIPATDGAQDTCYSQAFKLNGSGTVYFGDLQYYNSSNFRSVIVIK